MNRLFFPCRISCLLIVLVSLAATAAAAPIQWTVASGGNDHFYELRAFQFTDNWTYLPDRADDFTYQGLVGHVATVTSAAENQFILDTFGGSTEKLVFLGGNDAATPGNWYWQDGPEQGMAFWDEQSGTTTSFANWEPGQPNRPDVHYLAMSLKTGGWYDTNNGGYTGGPSGVVVSGYMVEYSVPEPATVMLLIAGVMGVMQRRPQC